MRELNKDDLACIAGGFQQNSSEEVDEIVVTGTRPTYGYGPSSPGGVYVSSGYTGGTSGTTFTSGSTNSSDDSDLGPDENNNGIPDVIDEIIDELADELMAEFVELLAERGITLDNGALSRARDQIVDAMEEAVTDDILSQVREGIEDVYDIPGEIRDDLVGAGNTGLRELDSEFDNVGQGFDDRVDRLFTVPSTPGGRNSDGNHHLE